MNEEKLTVFGYRKWRASMDFHVKTLRDFGSNSRCAEHCPCTSDYAIGEQLLPQAALDSDAAWSDVTEFLKERR